MLVFQTLDLSLSTSGWCYSEMLMEADQAIGRSSKVHFCNTMNLDHHRLWLKEGTNRAEPFLEFRQVKGFSGQHTFLFLLFRRLISTWRSDSSLDWLLPPVLPMPAFLSEHQAGLFRDIRSQMYYDQAVERDFSVQTMKCKGSRQGCEVLTENHKNSPWWEYI